MRLNALLTIVNDREGKHTQGKIIGISKIYKKYLTL